MRTALRVFAISIALAIFGFPLAAMVTPEPPAMIIPVVNGAPQPVPPVIDIGVVKPGRPQTITQTLTNDTGQPIVVQSISVASPGFQLVGLINQAFTVNDLTSFKISVMATGEGAGPITGYLVIEWVWNDIPSSASIRLDAEVDLVESEAPNLALFEANFEGRMLPFGLSVLGVPQPPQVRPEAALAGFQGLWVGHAGPASPSFVQRFFPDARAMARVEFLFDPNSLALAAENAAETIVSLNDYGTPVGWLEMRFRQGGYQLRAATRLDNGATIATQWLPIPDEPAHLTFDWWTGLTGQYEGGVRIRLTQQELAELRTPNLNFPRARSARLGAVGNVADATEGAIYFDDLAIRY
jgi:hypothetical protein